MDALERVTDEARRLVVDRGTRSVDHSGGTVHGSAAVDRNLRRAARSVRRRASPGAVEPVASEPGYDNQPFFTVDASGNEALLFTSQRAGEQTEIYRWEFTNARLVRLTDTEESEYSPTPLPEGGGFSVVRVEADGRQRLWRFDADGSSPRLLIENLAPVGYHAWAGAAKPSQLITFVSGFRRGLGQHAPPSGLWRTIPPGEHATIIARRIGRALHRIPTRESWSFVAPRARELPLVHPMWGSMRLRPPKHAGCTNSRSADGAVTPLAPVFSDEGDQDLAWTPDGQLVMARGSVVAVWNAKSSSWLPMHDFASQGIAGITRLAINNRGDRLAFVAVETDGRSLVERHAAGIALVTEAREKGVAGDWKAARHALERAAVLLPAAGRIAASSRRRGGA